MAVLATAVYGLVIGSFINVIIDRLPVALDEPNQYGELWDTRPWGEVLGGTSRCSSCGTPIRYVDNIPVISFLILRGRCRGCSERIPVFHPLVELIVPVLAVLAVLRLGAHLELIPVLWLIPAGVAIATIDLRTLMVPTRIVWPTFAVSLVITVAIAVAEGVWRPLLGAIIGMAVLAGPLFAIWWIHPKGMGFGDVRLAVLIGWNVGFAAMSVLDRPYVAVFLTLMCLITASLLGLIVGVALQAGLGRPVPFGPSLIAGALICMTLAAPILDPFI